MLLPPLYFTLCHVNCLHSMATLSQYGWDRGVKHRLLRYPVSSDISDKYFIIYPYIKYKRRKKCVIVSRFKIAPFLLHNKRYRFKYMYTDLDEKTKIFLGASSYYVRNSIRLFHLVQSKSYSSPSSSRC